MEHICHLGRITAIKDNIISVEINSQSACTQCPARSKCSMTESVSKNIDIAVFSNKHYKVGEEVKVGLTVSQGYKAVIYGYVFPLLLILGTLVITSILGWNEGFSGISSIIILIPYYLGLFLNRKKLHQQFNFTISKK